VQHHAYFDYIAVSASLEDRVVEYVDHLHEHFFDPVTVRQSRYVPPTAPGFSITMKPESLDEYEFPNGPVWRRGRHEPAYLMSRKRGLSGSLFVGSARNQGERGPRSGKLLYADVPKIYDCPLGLVFHYRAPTIPGWRT
jgi:hypothetical protein